MEPQLKKLLIMAKKNQMDKYGKGMIGLMFFNIDFFHSTVSHVHALPLQNKCFLGLVAAKTVSRSWQYDCR